MGLAAAGYLCRLKSVTRGGLLPGDCPRRGSVVIGDRAPRTRRDLVLPARHSGDSLKTCTGT